MLLGRAHVPTVLVSVVVLEAIDISIINFLISDSFLLAALNGETCNLELSFFPFGEGCRTIALPEHSLDPLELIILFSSELLVPGEFLDVLESLVPKRVFYDMRQCFHERYRTSRVVPPSRETSAKLALEVVTIVIGDKLADYHLEPCSRNSCFVFLSSDVFLQYLCLLPRIIDVALNILVDLADLLGQFLTSLVHVFNLGLLSPLDERIEQE